MVEVMSDIAKYHFVANPAQTVKVVFINYISICIYVTLHLNSIIITFNFWFIKTMIIPQWYSLSIGNERADSLVIYELLYESDWKPEHLVVVVDFVDSFVERNKAWARHIVDQGFRSILTQTLAQFGPLQTNTQLSTPFLHKNGKLKKV